MATKTVIHKVKTSQVTATPSSLAFGELAISTQSGSPVLFVGDSTTSSIKIGAAADVTKLAGIAAGAQVNTVDSVAGKTGVVTLVKGDVGLGNVDNTSDTNKPVSTAGQTALNLKADLASPTFTGTVSGISKSMVGLGNADNTSDVNKPVSSATQTALNLKAPLASPTFTGTVTVPTPSNNTDAATKAYVDQAASTGLTILASVRATSASNVVLASGVQNGSSFGGVTLATNDRFLLHSQTDAKENGVYTVNVSGAPTRALDCDNVPSVEIKYNTMIFVTSGTSAGEQWAVSNLNPPTIGVDPINFTQFGGGVSYSAGSGLTQTGTVFSLANHSASYITSGTLDDARLSANVIFSGDTLDGGSF